MTSRSRTVLITGGAGFIGSHVADELIAHDYQVRVLDCLDPQIHGQAEGPPAYLHSEVDFRLGDIRDQSALASALQGVDAVVHLAAAVGVGQSMYRIAHYTSVNELGTATLLEALAAQPVEKLVVASSMSIYGEGLYRNRLGDIVSAEERSRSQLASEQWEVLDSSGYELTPVPTTEDKPQAASSIYALSKFVQERQCLIWGDAYEVPVSALRFFNAYGPRQSLANPYTGVLAIFAAKLLHGQSPLIFEDGYQRRDFVNVRDVARACRLALESPRSSGEVFNIASGEPRSILAIATELAQVLNCPHIEPEILGRFRVGDIRHCFADISKAQDLLAYEPKVSFETGMRELADWLVQQDAMDMEDVPSAREELLQRGLVL